MNDETKSSPEQRPIGAVLSDEDLRERLERLRTEVEGLEAMLAGRNLDDDAPEVGALFDGAAEMMRRRAAGDYKPLPIPDWPSLANAIGGGLWPGLHVLVGGTATGKSQFALQLSLGVALAGIPVLYVGLELGREDLVARLVGLIDEERRIQWSKLWLGQSNVTEILDRCADRIRSLPFRLEVAGPYGWDYERLYPRAAAIRERYLEALEDDGKPQSPFLVVLDFLQIVASPRGANREDLRQRIQQAAYAARRVARDLDAAVLLISSTARGSSSAGDDKYGHLTVDKAPANPADFIGYGKESGEIEYAADTVMTMLREKWEGSDPPKRGTTIHLAIAKVRAGVPNLCTLQFNGTRFTEPHSPVPTVVEL